jgi:hypothetical protein
MRFGGCVALALATITLPSCSDPAPRSRAQRIGAESELVGGPKAVGRIGDYLLENDKIRLVISDKGQGRVNTPFGGSLIDADIQRVGGQEAGNDQLAEVLPAFLFAVINPTEVTVANNGGSGGAAEITVKGTGGDLLQTVALLNSALLFPPSLAFQQIYRLAPGKNYVEIETTVTNKTAGMHLLPYLEPSKLRDAGLKIPGIENLSFSVPMGQLLLLGGEQELFAPGKPGFNIRFTIEDSYATAKGFPSFPGLVVDYLATKGRGVSYGFTIPEQPSNYAQAFIDRYQPGQSVTKTSILLPFTYAGVAGAFTNNPPASLAAGASFTFRSYFIVGNGDAASILESIYQIRGMTTGEFVGLVVDQQSQQPIRDASVMVFDSKGGYMTQAAVDETGAFHASLQPGDYTFSIVTGDRPTTAPKMIRVVAAQKSPVRVEVPPPGAIAITVLDELGRRAPVKVTLIGNFDASNRGKDPRTFLYSLALGERKRPTAFDGGTEFIENQWTTPDGVLRATARPGKYDLVVSRGPEYQLLRVPIELISGGFVTKQLRLTREFSTPGWVAGDFHLHASPSTDSDLSLDERVISCAAEGLDVAAATDHNFVTDYRPYIAGNKLDDWLVGLPGMELTTFEAGHFNGYPLRVDAGSTRGGEFTWTNQPPQKLFDQLRNDLAAEPGKGIVQINHPRQTVLGYFAQFFLDSETGEPYSPTGIIGVFAPYGDEFKADKFSYDFDAIELITGKREQDVHTFVAPTPLPPGPFPDPQPVAGQIVRGPDGRPNFPGTVESWFTLLDRGHRSTGVGTSDSHGVLAEEPGYARTMIFVGAGKDGPGGFSGSDVVTAIRNHHAIATTAPFIEMTVGDGQIGDTIKAGPRVTVNVRVRSPSWAPVDNVILYSNSAIVGQQTIPAALGTDYQAQFTIDLPKDSWVVAEATGSKNMFPIVAPVEVPGLDASILIKALSSGLDLGALPLTAKLKPADTHSVYPYAITNPIWIDVDGGGWKSPKPPLRSVASGGRPAATAAPSVRDQFHNIGQPEKSAP